MDELAIPVAASQVVSRGIREETLYATERPLDGP